MYIYPPHNNKESFSQFRRNILRDNTYINTPPLKPPGSLYSVYSLADSSYRVPRSSYRVHSAGIGYDGERRLLSSAYKLKLEGWSSPCILWTTMLYLSTCYAQVWIKGVDKYNTK